MAHRGDGRYNPYKVVFLLVCVVVIGMFGYKDLEPHLRTGHPAAQQLSQAWASLVAQDRQSKQAVHMSGFAVALGRISFPPEDVEDAHTLIRSAVTLSGDLANSLPTFHVDLLTFHGDAQDFFADLGMATPSG